MPVLAALTAAALALAATTRPTPTDATAFARAAQPAVRAARPAATTTPLRDDDLAWIAPLMAIQGADQKGEVAGMQAANDALGAHASNDAAAARVARLRAGTLRALDELRRYSPQVVAPSGARYGAACSGEMTAQTGGLVTTAAYHVADVAAARGFYRLRGWEVLGDSHSGYVLISPDRKVRGGLGAPNLRALLAHYERNGVDMSAIQAHCPELLDGRGLLLQLAGGLESEAQASAAYEAAKSASPERLPGALRQAGLTPAQWEAVWAVIMQAQSDEMLVAQPGVLERDAGSAAEVARRRANVAWYRRNRAAVDAAVGAVFGGG